MARTVATGYWKASSHDPNALGSGPSAAILEPIQKIRDNLIAEEDYELVGMSLRF